jgi:hypothetical protein
MLRMFEKKHCKEHFDIRGRKIMQDRENCIVEGDQVAEE